MVHSFHLDYIVNTSWEMFSSLHDLWAQLASPGFRAGTTFTFWNHTTFSYTRADDTKVTIKNTTHRKINNYVLCNVRTVWQKQTHDLCRLYTWVISDEVNAPLKRLFGELFKWRHSNFKIWFNWDWSKSTHTQLISISIDGRLLKGRIDRLPFAAKWVQLH